MRDDISSTPHKSSERLWLRRVAWLVVFWAGGVLVMGAAAYALKFVMRLAGLTT